MHGRSLAQDTHTSWSMLSEVSIVQETQPAGLPEAHAQQSEEKSYPVAHADKVYLHATAYGAGCQQLLQRCCGVGLQCARSLS